METLTLKLCTITITYDTENGNVTMLNEII